MLETTNVVKLYLENKLNQIYLKDVISRSDHFNYLYNIRNQKEVWLRPYLVRKLYEVSEPQNEWCNILPALAASEVFNISTYQSNIVFDNKTNNSSHLDDSNQYIASMISYDLSIQMIAELNTTEQNRFNLIKKLSECNTNIYFGQHLDVNVLTINNFSEIEKYGKEKYIEQYLKRCELIGGSTIDYCCFSALSITNIDRVKINRLCDALSRWGKLMQIINDFSDCLIFINNYKDERFSDLRHGKITLPIYLMIFENDKIKNCNEFESFVNYNFHELKKIIPNYLYKDSPIAKEIADILFKEWIMIKNDIFSLDVTNLKNLVHMLFENIFLTKFSRYFFSNQLIRNLKKQYDVKQ